MILSLTRPTDNVLEQFLSAESCRHLTYPEVGATRASLPESYRTDRVRVSLGRGERTLRIAATAILNWMHFDTGWTEVFPPDAPVLSGRTVAVMARRFGVWTVHSCRIIDVVRTKRSAGFVYGTLPGHGETGEERFLTEEDSNGHVWYEVTAFFRPRDWRVRLLWPALAPAMNRFRRDSAQAMRRAVADSPRCQSGECIASDTE